MHDGLGRYSRVRTSGRDAWDIFMQRMVGLRVKYEERTQTPIEKWASRTLLYRAHHAPSFFFSVSNPNAKRQNAKTNISQHTARRLSCDALLCPASLFTLITYHTPEYRKDMTPVQYSSRLVVLLRCRLQCDWCMSLWEIFGL